MFGRHLRQSRFSPLCLLIGMVTSLAAEAEPCEPDQSGWSSSRYYPPGTVVFHEGQWFKAREAHEGKEPGISFEWKELETVPDCKASSGEPSGNSSGAATDSGNDARPGQTSRTTGAQQNDSGVCERPQQWLFSRSYAAGNLVSHGGKVWKATRKNSGEMPGMSEPPRWQLVTDHCSLEMD